MPHTKSPMPRDIRKLRVERSDGIYTEADYQVCESIGYLLKRSYILLSTAIDQELAPYDLTHPQFSILMMIKERNCSTAADLARETCNDTGAITRMLDRLEAKGILLRTRSSADRRVVNIELTDFGKLVAEKMPVVTINVLNRHLQDFSADEVAQFKHLLRKLIDQSGDSDKNGAAREKKS